jgi:hypothetical protein
MRVLEYTHVPQDVDKLRKPVDNPQHFRDVPRDRRRLERDNDSQPKPADQRCGGSPAVCSARTSARMEFIKLCR